MQFLEKSRAQGALPSIAREHISCVMAGMDRYGIKDSFHAINLNETHVSFVRTIVQSLRKDFGPSRMKLVAIVESIGGSIEKTSLMAVESAIGDKSKPLAVYSGKQPHFR